MSVASPPAIVITGGSSGIGAATALAFAAQGWRIGLMARHREYLEGVAARCTEAGAAEVRLGVGDVTDVAATAEFAGTLTDAWGSVRVLFLNAGMYQTGRIESITLADFRQMLEVNLTGVFIGLQALLPLVRHPEGWVIFNSSIAGLKGYAANGAYAASKYGVRGLADVLRAESAESGMRVTTLYPGPVATPIWQKLGGAGMATERMIPAEEVGSLLVSLALGDPRMQVEELTLTPRGYLR